MPGSRPQMVKIFIKILKIIFLTNYVHRAGLQFMLTEERTDYIYMYSRNNSPTRYLNPKLVAFV